MGVWLQRLILLVLCMVALSGCGGVDARDEAADQRSTERHETAQKHIVVQVNEQSFSATLTDTEAATALAERLAEGALELTLSDYGGFEKVGSLGMKLPADDVQMQAGPGDIMLYQGDQIVFFYGSNSWRYTALGQIDDLNGWAEALGAGDVVVTVQLAE